MDDDRGDDEYGGLLTASESPVSNGTVTATSGTVSGTDSVNVPNQPPTVATAARPRQAGDGHDDALSVLGADDGGEANLTYTWAATGRPSGPPAPTFSANGTNAAKNTTATFSKAGAYTFTVTITDAGGLTATSSVNVTVNQTLTTIAVSPPVGQPARGGDAAVHGDGKDQFGTALSTQPTFTWTTTAGTISTGGLLTAPQHRSATGP